MSLDTIPISPENTTTLSLQNLLMRNTTPFFPSTRSPSVPIPHLAMSSLRISPTASSSGPLNTPLAGPSSRQPLPHLAMNPLRVSPTASSSGLAGPSSRQPQASKRLLFIEMPRMEGLNVDAKGAQGLVSYDRYCLGPKPPPVIRQALQTAPPGFAFKEELEKDDPHWDLESYQIHDVVGIFRVTAASD